MMQPTMDADRFRGMRARMFTFAWVALAYAVLGKLGLALAVPPGYATAIWPPAGIALAAVLLRGYGALPGIAAGALLLDVWAPRELGPLSGLPYPGELSASLGFCLAAAGRAALGAALVRRFGRFPNPLDTVGRVCGLLVFGGAVPSFALALLQAGVFWLVGHLTLEDLEFSAATSWIGGTLGVVVFTPLVIVWLDGRQADWKERRTSITIWLAASFLLTFYLVEYANREARGNLHEKLNETSLSMAGRLEKTIAVYMNSLYSLEEICSIHGALDRDEFLTFSQGISSRVPGIQTLSWIPRVPAEQRGKFERSHTADFGPGFAIRQFSDGKLVRAGERPEYFPILFARSDKSYRMEGIDIAGEATRLVALSRARDTGEVAVTDVVPFFHGSSGVLAYLAVYQPHLPHDTVEQRRGTFTGIVAGVFQAADIIKEAFDQFDLGLVHYWLTDITAPESPRMLAADTSAAPAPFVLAERGVFGGTEQFEEISTFDLGGRRWALHVAPTEKFIAEYRLSEAWIILLGGLVFTSLLGASAMVVTGREMTLRRTAEERRQALADIDRFRDLADSASDWFWETDDQYRLTFITERFGAALGAKPSAVLGFNFFDLGLAEEDAAKAHLDDIAARRPFRDLVFHLGPHGGWPDDRSIRISGIPVFAADGRFTGYRGVGVDVTREVVAERRATLAQQQLVDAIDGVSDAIAVFDAEGRFVICNRAHRKMFEFSRTPVVPGVRLEELLDANSAFIDTGDLSFAEWKAARLQNHRQADGHPFILRTSGGQWIVSREFRTRDGGVIGVRSDITDIKRREDELDTLRRRYQSILDSAGEGIVGLDPQGLITFANRTAEALLGYDRDALIGGAFQALVQPYLDYSPVVAACRAGMRREVDDELFRRRDGSDFPADYFITPIVEGEANLGAVLIVRDATLRIDYERSLANHRRELERQVAERTSELKREVQVRAAAEGALRASRERLKRITDSLFEGLLVVDHAGQIAFANPSAKRLLGCDPLLGDVEGLALSTFLRLRGKEDDVPLESALLPRVFEDGVTLLDDDAVFALASGKAFSVAYACSPLPDDDGRKAVVISFRDTEQLKAAQREALQSSRLASVGQLAAGIAHEINTPVQYIGDNLRYVGGALDKLLRVVGACSPCIAAGTGGAVETHCVREFHDAYAAANIPILSKEAKLAVEESLDGVGQIARIVLSMKEFSHPGTRKKVITDINRALDSTLTVTRNEWKHVAEIDKQFDPSLPPVLCHPGEMNQVFLNLIVNAVHAIQASGKPSPGRITITTTHDETAVEIRLADTGIGVPEALLDKIFDPFFTTKEVGKGTGQGLAICRDVVVTKHGGAITVDGRDGEGAVFVVRLPVEPRDQDSEREGE
jgi:PAS domain S-box-containing protein